MNASSSGSQLTTGRDELVISLVRELGLGDMCTSGVNHAGRAAASSARCSLSLEQEVCTNYDRLEAVYSLEVSSHVSKSSILQKF